MYSTDNNQKDWLNLINKYNNNLQIILAGKSSKKLDRKNSRRMTTTFAVIETGNILCYGISRLSNLNLVPAGWPHLILRKHAYWYLISKAMTSSLRSIFKYSYAGRAQFLRIFGGWTWHGYVRRTADYHVEGDLLIPITCWKRTAISHIMLEENSQSSGHAEKEQLFHIAGWRRIARKS